MSEQKNLTSIIIPNYNHGNYLKQRIESILQQTYQHFEIIILDDYSTDQSVDIIESYRNHPKISQIILNDINSGSPFKQWKKGIEVAKGEFIWIAESDDWCEPTFLENIIPALISDPQVAISYCQSYCTKDNEILWQSNHAFLSEKVAGNTFIDQFLTPNPAIFNASMAVWRKRNFEQISPEYLKYSFSGDWLFWIELSKTGIVHISGKLLNYFRKHNHDVSSKAYQSGLNFIEGVRILSYCRNENFISNTKFKKSIKKNIKEFYLAKSYIPASKQKEIENLLISKTSKLFYYTCIASAIWKKIKN